MKNTILSITASVLTQWTASAENMDRAGGGARFSVDSRAGSIVIMNSGGPVGEYVFRDETIPRPYFANLRAPDGVQVTRHHPPLPGSDATDHAKMHPGVWLAFGDLNGQDSWRNKAPIEHLRFTKAPSPSDGELTFATESRMLGANRQPIGTMLSEFRVAESATGYLLIWDARFVAEKEPLRFGDQEEMGLGVRVASPLVEKNGGRILSSSGARTAKATWGRPFDWCDYSARVNGQSAGVTLMTDPANFRPSWFHNRDYGLMVANPFGRKAMNQGEASQVTVRPGETLRLRFGILLHAGETIAHTGLRAAYEDFLSRLSPREVPGEGDITRD